MSNNVKRFFKLPNSRPFLVGFHVFVRFLLQEGLLTPEFAPPAPIRFSEKKNLTLYYRTTTAHLDGNSQKITEPSFQSSKGFLGNTQRNLSARTDLGTFGVTRDLAILRVFKLAPFARVCGLLGQGLERSLDGIVLGKR